ncbi:LLM class flavin-dependent oxidoreductase [Niveispirillum sp.]|uniref:LLM class flavin-dependent oxidoreductase n=1 Tax=Niveispirillum sp. TaxID=1917217 RepID=UPI001B661CCB|nr:LLM class flavin-dependent oxidoreductase [Niveispirillum sp.]MBP7337926.1 LLM class flavin-dependent oxidoreductase [Niveispirillum sp.]
MSKPADRHDCATTGPLFSRNKMKLGVFGLNVSSAGAITTSPDRHRISWPQNVRLVRMAEDAGIEAAVPFARWRGFGGATNPWGESFETFTWAAGLAAVTSRIALVCTVNMMTMPVVAAAKQVSTIDHISNGRAVMNVVAGWMETEMKMFGVGALGHAERYAQGAEWMEALTKLWTLDEPFDLHGKYMTVEGGFQLPKSVQTPRPPLMNAAFSATGHAFAARWADIAFISPNPDKPQSAVEQVTALKAKAAEQGRDMQVWVATSIAGAPTSEAARAYVQHYSGDLIDKEAVENFTKLMMGGTNMPDEQKAVMLRHVAAHIGGYPLVGSYQEIADKIGALAEAGVDGLCLTWMDHERGLPDFIGNILPLMEHAGLRLPARTGADA